MNVGVVSMMDGTKLLSDGRRIPVLGLGTYLAAESQVTCALKEGYRLIDTATLYDNEEAVGEAIRKSGLQREEIFVVTKLWNSNHGRANTKRAFSESLAKLGLQYVDLYLMHSAMGGKTVETWDTMIELKEKGLIRSIGVANFNTHHLEQLKCARPDHAPVVNQIETHPFLAWDDCVEYCQREGITVMAYSPLAKAQKLSNRTLVSIARKCGRSPAQVMIRWGLLRGFIPIPKSSREERIRDNCQVFDFTLSDNDMLTLSRLDEHYISDWPGAMDHPWVP